jgi:hypothetical protein
MDPSIGSLALVVAELIGLTVAELVLITTMEAFVEAHLQMLRSHRLHRQ